MSKQLWNGWRAGCVQVPRCWRRSSRVTQEPARAAYSPSSNAGHASRSRSGAAATSRKAGSLSWQPEPSSGAYEPFPNGERSSTRWRSAHRRPPNQSSRCVSSRPLIGPSCLWVPRSSSLTTCTGPTVSRPCSSTIWPAAGDQVGQPLALVFAGRRGPALQSLTPASLEQVLSADRFVGLELGPLGREAGTTLALELAPGLDRDQATLIWERRPWLAVLDSASCRKRPTRYRGGQAHRRPVERRG